MPVGGQRPTQVPSHCSQESCGGGVGIPTGGEKAQNWGHASALTAGLRTPRHT